MTVRINEYFDVVYRTLLALRAIVVARLMVGTTMQLFSTMISLYKVYNFYE